MTYTIGGVIRRARRDLGINQKVLAARIGIKPDKLSRLENNHPDAVILRPDLIRRICTELGITADTLLGLANPKQTKTEKNKPLFDAYALDVMRKLNPRELEIVRGLAFDLARRGYGIDAIAEAGIEDLRNAPDQAGREAVIERIKKEIKGI